MPNPNGDEDRYPDRRGSFTKTMPHDGLGEVESDAYQQWLAILASGKSAEFAKVPRDPSAVERLNNPQATYAFSLIGPDPTALPLASPPNFSSHAAAAEMAELYWLALMRDVPFRDYDTATLAAAAAADLKAVGFAPVSPAELFRGDTPGDRRGPFVSQFLWRDIPFGPKTIDQRFRVPSRGQRFLTTFEEWLACQRGARSKAELRIDSEPRYISSYCELAEYVHRDFSFQPFMDAALIILRMGGDRGDAVLSRTNPYRGSSSQFGDITFGDKNLLTLVAEAALLAQTTSYYQKWQVHRRARPESMGGRIEVHLAGRKSYDMQSAILECNGLARIKSAYGSRLLPQAYPEGCPTHPSYPAAHAVNAAACATVLKAFFDDAFVIPEPVQATRRRNAARALARRAADAGRRDRQARREHCPRARCGGGALSLRQRRGAETRRRGHHRAARRRQPRLQRGIRRLRRQTFRRRQCCRRKWHRASSVTNDAPLTPVDQRSRSRFSPRRCASEADEPTASRPGLSLRGPCKAASPAFDSRGVWRRAAPDTVPEHGDGLG